MSRKNTSLNWIYQIDDDVLKYLVKNGFYVIILKELEPSENSKELKRKKLIDLLNNEIYWEMIKEKFPEYKNKEDFVEDYLKEWKYEIKYYLKSKKLICTCLGFKSASKVGRVCHHLYDFLLKNGLESDFSRRICPKKWQKKYLDNQRKSQ